MASIRERVKFAQVFLFNPMNRSWYNEALPELAYTREKWVIQGELLQKTLAILTKRLPDLPADTAWCFVPRHMVVFYDEGGSIIGHVKVCLECGKYQVFPFARAIQDNSIEYFRIIFNKLGVDTSGPYGGYFKNAPLESILFSDSYIDFSQ